MAILFVGSSPSDLGGATINNTTANGRDAAFTPVGSRILFDADGSGAGFNIVFAEAASDTVWLHFLHSNDAYPTGTHSDGDGYWFRVVSGATEIARVDMQDSYYYLQGGGASRLIDTPSYLVNQTYDMKIQCSGTVVTIELYRDGVLAASPITYTSAVAVPTLVIFDHFDLLAYSTAKNWYYSEVIITDNEPTLGWRLATLTPALDGNSTDWSGAVADIVADGDGLSINSVTATEKQSWTLSAYGGPATASGVRAVVNKFVASAGNTGPSQITPFVRHAATDVDGTPFTPDGSFVLEVFDNNPQTTLAWDTADLAALEVGVQATL
jgi:hypothetical protein